MIKLTKKCEECDKLFDKSLTCSNVAWGKRRFCSQKCSQLGKVGKPLSEDHRKKISESRKGKKHPFFGKKLSEEHRKNLRKAKIGELNPNWNTNREEVTHDKRNDGQYKQWRKEVRKRDRNECQLLDENCCGDKVTHHIKPWALYKELRYEINNGITLCKFHHPKRRKDEIDMIKTLEEIINLKYKQ